MFRIAVCLSPLARASPYWNPVVVIYGLRGSINRYWVPFHHGNQNAQSFLVFFFLFSFCHPTAYGVPRPGIIPELQLRPTPQCGHTRSLTHCARPGIKPVSQGSRGATDPIAPQQELQKPLVLDRDIVVFSGCSENIFAIFWTIKMYDL